METHAHVIVGAGSAGLATGALLRRAGLEPVLLEAGPEPGAAWRQRYDRLHLHTPRLLSGLPGRRIPRRLGRWVARDGLLDYFRDYAEGEKLDVRTGIRVERIDRDGDAWLLATTQGRLRAADVIVATGYNGNPFIPQWPGLDGFTGEVIHSSAYRNPAPFAGRDVLVVGAGNSGAEIATDVADGGASRARLSVRTPPQILRRATAGIPAQLIGIAIRKVPPSWVDPISKAQRRLSIPDLAAHGLPRPELGVRSSFIATGTTPVLDVGIVDAVRHGRVEVVAAVESFDGPEVLLADGSRIDPDVVIAATGFRAGLDELVGHLDVLGPRGLPVATDGRPALPGLWFVGFTPTLGGQLREGSIAARRVAAAVSGARTAS
ncbi:MAG: putative flavoprotein involved in transport [Gaiellaceae bacterium]|nr:putative flavoprotein involved in transport [Gaiellaceae bacterium]